MRGDERDDGRGIGATVVMASEIYADSLVTKSHSSSPSQPTPGMRGWAVEGSTPLLLAPRAWRSPIGPDPCRLPLSNIVLLPPLPGSVPVQVSAAAGQDLRIALHPDAPVESDEETTT